MNNYNWTLTILNNMMPGQIEAFYEQPDDLGRSKARTGNAG
jgi:hypothetical protein